MQNKILFRSLLILFLLSIGINTGLNADENEDPLKPEWIAIITPAAGWLNNETRFPFQMPSMGGPVERKAVIEDYGFGGGLVAMMYYKRISFTNVFFYFPKVNQSRLTGNVSYVAGTYPTNYIIEPYLGLGFVYANTDTEYRDFTYKEYIGSAVGIASFSKIDVDNHVFAPFPKIGFKLKIPVHHWYITPFYSYLYERVYTRAASPGGHVVVFATGNEYIGDPIIERNVDKFNTKLEKIYNSHLVGFDFFVDFHYFLQLRGKVYYNTNHELWTVRMIGSVLLTERFGVTAYFEYSEKITVTNTYALVGSTFFFAPEDFHDRISKIKSKGNY